MVSPINSLTAGASGSTSSTSGTPPITFGGLASGLNTNAIIDAILQQDKRPIVLAQQREATYQAQQATLAQINGDFQTLLGYAQSLALPATFNGRTTTVLPGSSDAGKLDASATSSAATGSFKVDIVSLATATTTASSTGIGQAVDQNVSLDQAGFQTPVTAGTFTINGTVFTIPAATSDSIVSASAVGAAVDPTQPLSSAGLSLAPTAGTFSINGVAISFDPATDSLDDVMTRINQSAAGVTATWDAGTQSLTLTNNAGGNTPITLADNTGNFLQSMNLIDGSGTKIGTETAGTDMVSLTDVMNMINGAGIGVTASVVNDSYGRANLLQLDGGGSNVLVGAGGDTSNFLAATNLLQSPTGTTRTSVSGIAGANTGVDLQDARLQTALSASTGTFTINGVQFAWDKTSDSLNNLISDINSSAAGVTAAYDATTDQLTLTSKTLGSSQITLSDDSGNFLAATGLLAAAQSTGTSASYRINGGALRYSTSNTVTNALPGVTLTFHDTTTSSVSVEIGADSSSATSAIQSFVDQYNKVNADIASATKYDSSGQGQNGVMFGDASLRIMSDTLHGMLTGPVLGFTGSIRTLSDVGISFGTPGKAVGTTDKLVFDASKFASAYQSDATTVVNLFTKFQGAVALDAGGTGSIASLSGTPTSATKPGKYSIASTAGGALTVTFTPDDGSTPIISSGSIAASGTNTTLIPGVTITAKGTLVAGTDSVTLSATTQGAGLSFQSYIDSLTRTDGVFDTRDQSLQSSINDLNKQIDDMNRRIDTEQQQLIQKYSNLEVTISQLQTQQQALQGMLSQLGLQSAPSSSKSSGG